LFGGKGGITDIAAVRGGSRVTGVRLTTWPAGARALGAALEVALAATAVHRAEGQPTGTRILIAALELARLELLPVCERVVKVKSR
jgi:hypothetical protein